MTGMVVYRGPSRLTGAEVVLIVTLSSLNFKTGDMAQAWILLPDQTPSEAITEGADRAICGDCVHRSGGPVGRSCYVVWWQGPTNVYKAFQKGRYPVLTIEHAAAALTGLQLRCSAYGDPAAVPFDIWRRLLARVGGFTFYSHAWRVCDERFKAIAMASVESDGEVDQAHRLGWRTFWTRLPHEAVRADEIICPASDEADHRTTCAECRLCVGQQRPTARSIVIFAHGQRTVWLSEKKAAVNA